MKEMIEEWCILKETYGFWNDKIQLLDAEFKNKIIDDPQNHSFWMEQWSREKDLCMNKIKHEKAMLDIFEKKMQKKIFDMFMKGELNEKKKKL